MARKVLIQVLYGLEMNIGTLNIGEMGYCTDTQKLYIGTPSGNVLLVAAQTAGDMLKSIYDTDNDGIVDAAEKVNGHTVLTDVPANAKFTDTTYSIATTSTNGLMSALDKVKLDGIVFPMTWGKLKGV